MYLESHCRTMLMTLRWALLLAAFLITTQFAAADDNLPDLGDPTQANFNPREEARLGRAFYQALRANLTFIDDVQLDYYIRSLGQRLVTHSDAASTRFTFFILDSPSINAFAGPGAYIGINSGLILKSDNESELASVLAHEISHVSQRHIARAIDNSGHSAIATFATILGAILLGSQNPDVGQAALLASIAGSQQATLNFTRGNEYEADRIGIGLLAEAGINPEGMVEFFETLLKESGSGGIEYLRTHPLSANRVSEAKNRLQPDHAQLPSDSIDFRFARARMEAITLRHPEQAVEDTQPDASVYSMYQRAVIAMRADKTEQAIKLLETAQAKSTHPWILLALAESYLQAERDKEALEILEKLSGLYPNYLPVTLMLTDVLTQTGHAQSSIKRLKHQLQFDDIPLVHQQLARAYHRNGQIVAALESTGNQYARQGYIELAVQQYNIALDHPEISTSTRQRLQTKRDELKAERVDSE